MRPGRERVPVWLGGAVGPAGIGELLGRAERAELFGPAELRALGSGTEKPAV